MIGRGFRVGQRVHQLMERILLPGAGKQGQQDVLHRIAGGDIAGSAPRDRRSMAVPAKRDSFLIVDKIRDAVSRFREPRRSEQRFGLSLRVGVNALSKQQQEGGQDRKRRRADTCERGEDLKHSTSRTVGLRRFIGKSGTPRSCTIGFGGMVLPSIFGRPAQPFLPIVSAMCLTFHSVLLDTMAILPTKKGRPLRRRWDPQLLSRPWPARWLLLSKKDRPGRAKPTRCFTLWLPHRGREERLVFYDTTRREQ